MQSAAAEGARLVSTAAPGVSDQALRSFMLRRLSAVPDVGIFHEGGDAGWTIELEGSCSAHTARVVVETTARPLPLIGAAAGLLGVTDGRGAVVLRVEVERVAKPAWLGGGYDEWSSMW